LCCKKNTESWKSGQSQKEISKRRRGGEREKQKGRRNKKEGRKQVGGVLIVVAELLHC